MKMTYPSENCPRGCTLMFTPECRRKRDPWLCYEAEKKALEQYPMTQFEYRIRIKEITDRLGL